MKTYNAFTKVTICVLSMTILTNVELHKVLAQTHVNLHKLPDQSRIDCRRFVTGTYLTTSDVSDFGFFRSIITFTEDGNFFAIDSNQSGDPSLPPFSNTQGSWKCTSKNQIIGTSLNFSYPTATLPGFIARSDFNMTFDYKNGRVQGTAIFRSYELNANPLNDYAPAMGMFTFTGQRVEAGH